MSGSALDHIRVLEIGDAKGMYCGKLLADLGADVIKIEPPGGAKERRMWPRADSSQAGQASLAFLYYNSNKRSVVLDLADELGRARLDELVAGVDALVDATEPGDHRSWKLGTDRLHRANPSLISVRISGYGEDTPFAGFRTTDLTAMASSGVLSICGPPHRPPATAPGQQAFDLGSANAAFHVVLGIFARRRTGQGQHFDVSIQETLALQEHLLTRYSLDYHIYRRAGSQHTMAAPGRVYPCRDGFIGFFVARENSWQRYLELLDHPDALKDAAWNDTLFRIQNHDVIDAVTLSILRSRSRAEIETRAQSLHIPCRAVQTPGELLEDRHLGARGYWTDIDVGEGKVLKAPGPPYELSETPWRIRSLAPSVGQHSEDILNVGSRVGVE